MLDWIVVGGGPHGAFLADALWRAGSRELAVIDPAPDPLAAWRRRADACGMDFLRSPLAHHLGPRAFDLLQFAKARGYDARHFLGRYRRPSRAVFEAHADEVLNRAAPPRLNDWIRRLERQPGGWRLHGETDVYRARRVLLAPGPPPLRRPEWADDGIPHLFDAKPPTLPDQGETVIVGGGITAAQAALAFVGGRRRVTLVSPHPLRLENFDSEPRYAGPKGLRPFLATPDLGRRRAMIRAARHPGTLPPDIHARLGAAVAAGDIRLLQQSVIHLDDAALRLGDGRRLPADAVYLATGFVDAPPGDPWIGRLLARESLPLGPCGFPAPTPDLAWGHGLYVCGRLGELTLGPMAGNIRGARIAAERLVGQPIAEGRPPAREPLAGNAP